jgi:hypothetical protein
LSKVTSIPIPVSLLWLGILGGSIAINAALSEKVILDERQIQVCYPLWAAFFLTEVGLYFGQKLKV